MAYHDGSIRIDTKLDTTGINKGLSGLKKGLVVAGAAIGTAFTAAIAQGISFESAFAGVRKTVDATEAELAELKQGIRDLAKEMPTSANEIAGVAEAAGQLGISKDKILDFTKTMVMLGDSTNLTADEAATTLARFANITGMSQDNFNKLGSTIVALGNNFATTEAEISAMGMNIASAGSQVGMSEAQILGFATALSSVGMEAQAGGTAISKLMIDMQLATETGGESLNQFANVAGMSAEQFKTAFKEDAAGAITSFISGLNDTDRLGKSSIAVLDEMGISEVRLRDSILRAANAGDLFTDAIDTGTKAWEDNTALTKEAEQRYETMESKLGMLKNGLVDLGISVYDGLSEPLKDGVTEAIDALGELQKSISGGKLKSALSGIGKLFSELMEVVINVARVALPPLISALGFIGSNFKEVVTVVGLTVAAFKGFTIMQSVTNWFRGCMVAVNAYRAAVAANIAMETRGITISTLLASTMKVQEIAVGVLTGKIKLLIAAKALATKAQTALNAAWTANPVGVVVAGVTALTAGVIALCTALKKESAEEKAAKAAREAAAEAIKKQKEEAQQLYDEIDRLQDTYDDNVAGVEAEAKANHALADELYNLSEKQDKTIGEKERMKTIVDELNGSIDNLNLAYDEEKDKLSLTKDEVYKLIDAKKQLAMQNAIQDYLEEGYKAQFKLEFEEKGFVEEKQKAEQAIKDAQAEIDKILDNGITYSYQSDKKGRGKTKTITAYTSEQREQIKILQEDIETYKTTIDDLNESIETNSQSQKDNAETLEFYSDKLQSSYSEAGAAAIKSTDEMRVAWEMCANDYGSTSDGMLKAANAFYTQMEQDAGSYGSAFMAAWKSAIDTGAFDSATSIQDMFNIVIGIMNSGTAETTGAVQKIPDFMKTGINEKGGEVQTASEGMAEDAVDAADTVVTSGAPDIAYSYILGFTGGVYKNGFLVANAGTWLGNQFNLAVKAAGGIRSPSRVMRDEVAAMLTKGFAIGIKKNSYEVTDAAKQMFDDLKLQFDVGAINEAEYYKLLENYRDEYLEESTDEWWDYTKELMKYDEQLRDKQFEDLEWLLDSKQISEAEYYEKLRELRDKYFEEDSDEWREHTLELMKYDEQLRDKQFEDLEWYLDSGRISEKEYYEELKRLRDTYFEEGSEEWRDYTLEIIGYNESISEAVSDSIDEKFGGYFDPLRKIEIKDKDGNSEEFFILNDFARADELEKEYSEALDKLVKRAGDNPIAMEFVSDIKNIDDVTEAIERMNALLSASDEQWNILIQKKAAAEERATNNLVSVLGIDEQVEVEKAIKTGDLINNEITSSARGTSEDLKVISDSTWESIKNGFYEKFGTLPDDSYNIGVEMIKSLMNGALSQLAAFHEAVTSKILTPFKSVASAGEASDGTESQGGGGGDVYNFYSSKSTVHEQLKAARNEGLFKRMRGFN